MKLAKMSQFSPKPCRTPMILQMEAVECGAACLTIVLAHFGKWISLEEARVTCGVTRDGSNARSILLAGRHYGLRGQGVIYELETLIEENSPLIIYWKFNHFLVYEGFSRRGFHVNDPAVGHRIIDFEEFNKSYTGLALKFSPGPQWAPQGEAPKLWPVLKKRFRHLKKAVITSIWLSLMLIIPGVFIASFARIFIDEILIRKQSDWLHILWGSMIAVVILQAVMTWMLHWIFARTENKLSLVGSAQLLWHLLRLPYKFFTQRMSGDLVNRVRASDQVAISFGQDLGRTSAQLFAAIFYIITVVLFDPLLAAVSVSLTGVSVFITFWARRKLHELSLKSEMEESKLFANTVASIQNMETLKATGRESMAFIRWAGHHAAVVNVSQSLHLYTTFLQSSSILTGGLTMAAVLGLGSLRVMNGDLTVGGVVAIQAMVMAFKPPLEELAAFLTRLEQTRASLWRVDDVLNYDIDDCFKEDASEGNGKNHESNEGSLSEVFPTHPKFSDGSKTQHKIKLNGHIELRSVSFGYNATKSPLITDLNLNIEPGMRVALVGGSGSGKSTVAKLIVGLYQPWGGEIILDGRPANEWPRELHRNSIAWVNQDNFLFEGTIIENITLWDKSIYEGSLTLAARDAAIHRTITNRPGGYNGFIFEGGTNFSGGEAQQLELARALAIEPSILVLDEATSDLDPNVEVEIDGNLRRRGCTTLIIAHRLSTIRDCDEIIVLDKGRVLERGNHETLMAQKGRYCELIEH